MNEASFMAGFTIIQDKLQKAKGSYDFKTKEETWENIGTNPLDIAFTDLSELYLEAGDIRKKQIFEYAGTHGLPNDLWYFVRRVGQQIHLASDVKWLEVGIAAALIDGARGDFRDLIVSLTLLRFSAESHGIDVRPFFDTAIQSADEKMKSILTTVRNDKESSIRYVVQMFGAPPSYKEQKPIGKKKVFGDCSQNNRCIPFTS